MYPETARKALKAEPGEDAEAVARELDHRIAVARHQRKEEVRALEDRAWSTILAGEADPLRVSVRETLPPETVRVMEAAIRRRETGEAAPHDPAAWLAWRRLPDAKKREKTLGELHTAFAGRLDEDHRARLLDDWRALRGEVPEGDPSDCGAPLARDGSR